ncbi:UNVERIFIED_CONTAM: Exocyst complex component SEC5B [Sesamum radiatum]|uniref:Exocyst complex component SEC5 n=1 Tax=Sesamum radiatum TaxID=300843 RepID=A0AAW2QE29_SESRA
MSSGDDLDEDEMLQMALKEQSNRDVNYHKMSQGKQKPVRNYVQPPAGAQQRQKGMGKQRKPSIDEDDDSDVEMLSISSGDEDDRGRVPPRQRAGAGKDDDSAWDGEEPDCWKRVDEAALARRVREMRDTRAVPVIIKIDRRPKGKGLTSMQSLPRGMEWVDPLGLGLINHKTFRLISDNMIIPPTTDVEPLDPSARDIESKMKRIEEDPEGAGTVHLFNCIQGVCSVANRAFGPLFERQEQAEKIRSVQGMLQRFRTLFNLPSAIRGSISKGEYDLAVREYRKAKSIVLPSHVGILRRVLEEVEKVVHEFKTMLYKAMEDPNVDLTSLENTVRLLLELEPESDPIKHYLNIQNRKIRGLLEKCTLDLEARMENLQNELHERALSDAKWRQIRQT